MKLAIDIIKCILFLGIGLYLMLGSYDTFKEIFPKAPAPIVIKVIGGVITLCGIIILVLIIVER